MGWFIGVFLGMALLVFIMPFVMDYDNKAEYSDTGISIKVKVKDPKLYDKNISIYNTEDGITIVVKNKKAVEESDTENTLQSESKEVSSNE